MADMNKLFNLREVDTASLTFHIGLHVMVLVLALVAILIDGFSWSSIIFMVAYLAGMVLLRYSSRLIIRLLWFIGVMVLWGWFTRESPTAVYIVFSLFFLAMAIFPALLGSMSVLVLLAVAIVLITIDMGWTLGGVLGPLIAAAVAIALSLGVALLRREAAAREEASLIAGEMEERTRVAAEIHDTVAQGLSSIIMLMQSAELRLQALNTLQSEKKGRENTPSKDKVYALHDGRAGGELKTIREQVQLARRTAQDNLIETRRIISKLQASPLQGVNLAAALAQVAAETPLGESLEFEVDGTPYELPQGIEHELLRVTQSLVSNVVRHSQATAARITLTYLPGSIALDVVDNGIGIEEETLVAIRNSPVDSPVGLGGVRRRIYRLGGRFSIESDSETGTGVSIHVPIGS